MVPLCCVLAAVSSSTIFPSLLARCSKTKMFAGVFKLLKKKNFLSLPLAANNLVPVWPRPAEDGGHTQASVEPTTVVVW